MDFNLMNNMFNKIMPKSYDDIAKYSNMVMDHEVLDGKIKDIELDFVPSKEPIKYGGYEMIQPGTLVINVILNTEGFYEISDSMPELKKVYKLRPELEADSFLEFNGYEFIKNVKIIKNAHVSKLIFDDNRVTGLEFIKNGLKKSMNTHFNLKKGSNGVKIPKQIVFSHLIFASLI